VHFFSPRWRVAAGVTAGALALSASPAFAADVCYQGGALLPNFVLNGDASLDGTSLIVTQPLENQAGSVSYIPKLSTAGDVHISMVVQLTESGGSANGADGLAFVLHNSPLGTAALGEVGQGIGYGGISPSVVVEFDSYKNTWDTDDNRVAITRDGEFRHNVGINASYPQVASPVVLKSGEPVYLWMDYEHVSHDIKVFLAPTEAKPAAPTLTANIDLAVALGTDFFVTFTGSTGGAWSRHIVRELYASDIFGDPRDVCCNADADCPNPGELCDPAKHLCGPCTLGDSDGCDPATPACSLASSTNQCVAACTGDNGSAGANPCGVAFPACRPDGSCASCNGDDATAATVKCLPSAPFCSTTGFCGRCTSNADCATNNAPHGGAVCDVGTGACRACTTDLECGDGRACVAAACVAKAANGQPVPGGVCDDTTKSACASGVCDPADDTCGAPTGGTCASTAECRTGVCVAEGPNANTCQACGTASDCSGTTPLCGAASTCIGCTGDFAATDGALCPENAATCFANGSCAACTTNADCTQGGTHAGAICNPTTGTCGTSCTGDAQCDGGWCDAAGSVCTPRIGNGFPIPADAPLNGECTAEVGARICAASVCDEADDLCGSKLGAVCTSTAQCREGACEGGICALPVSDGGVPDGGTSSGGAGSSSGGSSGAASSSSGGSGGAASSGNGGTGPNGAGPDDGIEESGLSGGSGCATAGGVGSSFSSVFLLLLVTLSRRRQGRPQPRA